MPNAMLRNMELDNGLKLGIGSVTQRGFVTPPAAAQPHAQTKHVHASAGNQVATAAAAGSGNPTDPQHM